MFVKTDSGVLNLDRIVLVEIKNQFVVPRDDTYQLKAITTNIYEKDRQTIDRVRHDRVAHRPATILPYSVQITQGTFKDCQNRFDKIAEQDTFIKFTKDEYSRLLNLKHVIDVDFKQSSSDQSDYLQIRLNTFFSESSKFTNEYGNCHFPSLSPYELYLSDAHGYNCREIMEAIEKFGIF